MTDSYVNFLRERWPDASPEAVAECAALLEREISAANLEGEFTMEMLDGAKELGHEMAQILKENHAR